MQSKKLYSASRCRVNVYLLKIKSVCCIGTALGYLIRGRSSSKFKIPGAIRVTWDNFDEWSSFLPKDNTMILYCS